MELLRIRGGRRLEGSVAISGSKNAALPVMAAALLTDQQVELGNVPDIEDISTMARMLEHVGVAVEHPGAHAWSLHAAHLRTTEVDAGLSRRMRGSFLLLGALVARAGEASIAKPGGDDIGMRRVEQHLEGLRLMGAEVEERDGAYVARARRLHGARIALDMPTVTGTENLMMAAAARRGDHRDQQRRTRAPRVRPGAMPHRHGCPHHRGRHRADRHRRERRPAPRDDPQRHG